MPPDTVAHCRLRKPLGSGAMGEVWLAEAPEQARGRTVDARSDVFSLALSEHASEMEFVRSVDHALRGRIVVELHQRIGEAHLRLGQATEGRAALDLAVETYERRMRTGAADAMSPYYAAAAHALRGEPRFRAIVQAIR